MTNPVYILARSIENGTDHLLNTIDPALASCDDVREITWESGTVVVDDTGQRYKLSRSTRIGIRAAKRLKTR